MGFKITDESVPIPELVEMSAKFVHDAQTDLVTVTATLHIRPDEIDVGDDYVVTIRFKSAYLFLDPDNMKADPDSYHGLRAFTETNEEIDFKTTASRSAAKSRSFGVDGEIGGSATEGASGKGAGRFAAGGETRAEMSVERSAKIVEQYIPVEYYNANRWKITPQGGSLHLSGTFLRNDVLCTMTKNDGKPNKVGATLHLVVRRRDIDVLVDNKFVAEKTPLFSNSKNKTSLLNALVAKRLRGACKQKTEQDVTFALIEADDEG